MCCACFKVENWTFGDELSIFADGSCEGRTWNSQEASCASGRETG